MQVIILSDGIRGHFHQSLGVGKWLERLLNNAEIKKIKIIEVPKFRGIKKIILFKILARRLKTHNENFSRKWLDMAGFKIPDYINLNSRDYIFISAGSSAAPFNLALANITGCKSVVIMNPSILGVKPFNFAIVPEHDKINYENAINTLGAPNHIYIPDLKEAAEKFKNVTRKKIIAVLIGGNDANYKITPEWAEKVLTPLKEIDAGILITTSRRTGKDVDDEIYKIFKDRAEFILLASRDPDQNPVPAMLGKASHVLVTEDSVSMVSESVTAGFKAGLLRVERTTGFFKNLFGFGAKRFDELFNRFIEKNLIIDLGKNINDIKKFVETDSQLHNQNFNEAKRCAEYIIKSL